MKTITIKIPETKEELKEYNKDIREIEKGALRKTEGWLRKHTNKEFLIGYKKPLLFPFCCETCQHEGGAFWHCKNPESPKCYINVNKNNICPYYSANWGLMTYLWYRAWVDESKKWKSSSLTGQGGKRK